MIEISDFSYRYAGSQRPALDSIQLAIASGEFVLLSGDSGSGKSTLGMAIAALLFSQFEGAADGGVFVAGMDMQSTPVFQAADYVGLVQQNPEAQFCTLNVMDEVAFGLENRSLPVEEIRPRIDWALEIVDGLDLRGRELATLSGGEKQKVAVAAVLAAKPQVLILDEPTSNLDPTATREILECISRLTRSAGMTVIVIEHKAIQPVGLKPRQIHLDSGRLVYDGPLDEIRMHWSLRSALSSRERSREARGALVQVRDLAVSYEGAAAIQGVNLDLHSGEFVAVMGDNGSGKTTFLQALMGLEKPSNGSVSVMGNDTTGTGVSDLARQVAFVFQNPDHQLFGSSIWDEAVLAAHNFGLLDEDLIEGTKNLLAEIGLRGRHADHPYKLSYGEKRRLNLISVLNYAPTLILLDEILIGQDQENARFLLDMLARRVQSGAGVVLVNHNPHVTQAYADRVLFFERGKLLLDAPTMDAFRRLEELGLNHYTPAETLRLSSTPEVGL